MKTIVISLERRKDRRQRVEQHLKDQEFKDVLFYPAFDGGLLPSTNVIPPKRPYFSFKDEWGRPTNRINNFVIGCTLSHIGALKMAKALSLDKVLIVEDDVEFTCKEYEIDMVMKYLPDDWEMLYLGGAARTMGKYNEQYIIEPGFVDGLHAYIVKKEAYGRLINAMNKFLTSTDDSVNDARLKNANPVKGYMLKNKVAFQVPGFSELDRKVVDRKDLR